MASGPLVLIEELPLAVEDLWALWTEPAKVARWLSGGSTINLVVGGTYELNGHLATRNLSEPVGGAIVGLQEEYVLKVAWRLPAELGRAVRDATPSTGLTVLFQPLGPNRTRLRLEHDGWREGDEWTAALRWQTEVWTAVLERLKLGNLPV
ncbi:MAG: SRPBCC domain-containing protein [Thermoplasmata archaeon]|nr:SRPBCC domain-containing protein [Thermoplasmata archaeon]